MAPRLDNPVQPCLHSSHQHNERNTQTIDETATALRVAGPASWHHLIAPTRTFPLAEETALAAAQSMDAASPYRNDISAIYALTDLAATANILSNAIANTIFTTTALDIFKEARTASHILHVTNRDTPTSTQLSEPTGTSNEL